MICSSVIQQFISEHLKAIRNCLVSLLYFALWLVEKTRPTFSADWMQKWKNQSWLDHSRFRAPKPISTGPRYWGFSASTSSPARVQRLEPRKPLPNSSVLFSQRRNARPAALRMRLARRLVSTRVFIGSFIHTEWEMLLFSSQVA